MCTLDGQTPIELPRRVTVTIYQHCERCLSVQTERYFWKHLSFILALNSSTKELIFTQTLQHCRTSLESLSYKSYEFES